MCIAVPLGVGAAAFLSELAPRKLKAILKPLIEMLAAISLRGDWIFRRGAGGSGNCKAVQYAKWIERAERIDPARSDVDAHDHYDQRRCYQCGAKESSRAVTGIGSEPVADSFYCNLTGRHCPA